jgi:hypothetical protein
MKLKTIYTAADISTGSPASIFKPAGNVDFTDGIYSLWPRVKTVFLKKEVAASSAAKGDDDLMSTPARPVKS